MTDRELTHRGRPSSPLPVRDRLEGGRDAAPDRARPPAGLSRHRHGQPAPPLPRGGRRPGDRGGDRERPRDPRRPVPADEVHLPARAGPPPALRPGRARSRPRSSSRSPARSSTWASRRSIPTCCTAPRTASACPRPTGRRGGRWKPSTTAAGPACSASATSPSNNLEALCQQARVPPRFVQNRCYAARGWDRGRPAVLLRQRDRLPGLLAADRQPRGAGPSRAGPDRPAPRPDRQPDRLPVRPRRRHGAPDRHHQCRAHAGRSRRLRLSARSRRSHPDRAAGCYAISLGSTRASRVTVVSRWSSP